MIKLFHKKLIGFTKLYSRKNLNKLLIASIKKYTLKDQKIISIGSGGGIKRVLKEQGVDFQEIDIDEKRQPDFVCDIEDMNIFEDNSVDVFFCMEVLEHVKNPLAATKEIERVLKPGGVIIGSTPFVFPIHEEPYDYYRYTKYGLAHLFSNLKK